MTEVLPPPGDCASSPSPHMSLSDSPEPPPPPLALRPRDLRPQRERIPSYAEKRMSAYSHRTSRSRPQSNVFPAFQSSLAYALVRDFAYPTFHPMHYGASPEPPSGSTTPGSDWQFSRRSSDPMEGVSRGGWSAGPWGGDGVLFGDPVPKTVDPLPSTSFGDEYRDELGPSKRKHRKSRSYANVADLDRGRRRESGHGHHRRSRQIEDLFQNQDGSARRDSPLHTSRHVDPDSDMPLDSEIPISPSHSPGAYRQSIGPDDEDLYAGESLALYSFEPENANELRLTEGQHILVAYRHGQGWLVAEDKETGEQGLVPEAYVRLIADIPNYDPVEKRFLPIEDLEDDTDDVLVDFGDESTSDNSYVRIGTTRGGRGEDDDDDHDTTDFPTRGNRTEHERTEGTGGLQ